MEYIDSLDSDVEVEDVVWIFCQAFHWLCDEAVKGGTNKEAPDVTKFTFKFRRMNQQQNHWDCGVFLLLRAMYVLDGRDFRRVDQALVSKFRLQIFCHLTNDWFRVKSKPESLSSLEALKPVNTATRSWSHKLTEANLKNLPACGFLATGFEGDAYFGEFQRRGYHVVDVIGDGNCGYYAVFLGLVDIGKVEFSSFDTLDKWQGYLVSYREGLRDYMRHKRSRGFLKANENKPWFQWEICAISSPKHLNEEINNIFNTKFRREQYFDAEFINRTKYHLDAFSGLLFISMKEAVRIILHTRSDRRVRGVNW